MELYEVHTLSIWFRKITIGRWCHSLATNVEAMTSKGLRAFYLSKYTDADASFNAGLTTKTFIGYSLC
jgi:hypothetical protein